MEAVAKLNNLPISPRKVRLVADQIRGVSATKGLALLKHAPKKCAIYLEKLLLSAVSNWEHKNEDVALEEADLAIKAIWVDSAGMLKRIKPAPQGRAHRIRKRASHITLVLDSMNSTVEKPALAAAKNETNTTEQNTDGAES
ncbi:MAG: 50S ribosomal protein L22 [Roseivirga sp.]